MDNLGVVVAVPFWSVSDNMNSDSAYVFMSKVLPEMTRQAQNSLFLLLFPDPSFGSDVWRYTPDGLQTDRIRFIKWPYDTQMQTSVLNFNVMRWKEIDVGYGPTLYWLNQIESGAQISSGYHKVYSNAAKPALVGHQHYVLHKSLPYVYSTQLGRLWAQMGGCIACDRVIYHTKYAVQMAEESYREYLNATTLTALRAKSVILTEGIVDGNEPIAPPASAGDKPRVVYNHRFEAYKDPHTTFDLLHELRQQVDFEICVTQAAGQQTSWYNYDRVIGAAQRGDYLANIAIPAVNTLNSKYETMCLAIVDSMTVGHLCVVPNALTFPEIMPPGYPYLFNSVAEQRAMLCDIFATWPAAYNEWRLPLAAHARALFGVQSYVTRYLQVIAEAELAHRVREPKEATLNAMHKVFGSMRKGKEYAVRDLTNAIRTEAGIAHHAMPVRRTVREAMMRDDIAVFWRDGVLLRRK